MKNVLSVDNMRKSDAYTIANFTSGRELMRRAGAAIYHMVPQWEEPVAILCGSGNNAGDGYVLAKLLHDSGKKVELILGEQKFSEDGRYYYDICMEAGIPASFWPYCAGLEDFGTIVDCLFGTGFRGVPKEPYRGMIEAVNAAREKTVRAGALWEKAQQTAIFKRFAPGRRPYVVSVDINSGLNGNNGLGEIFVRSDLTVSIGGYKPGHFLNKAKDAMLRKENADILIQPLERVYHLVEEEDAAACLPPRANFSNKGDYGYIALVGGSLEYSGAIRLAAMANCAMRAGAGVVSVAVPRSIAPLISENTLECTVFPLSDREGEVQFCAEELDRLCSRYRVIAIGMGIGNTPETEKCLQYLLTHYEGILLIDADGLSALAKTPLEQILAAKAKLVLTPHVKEFSRLADCTVSDVQEKPIESAEALAAALKAVVLLKGPTTVVTDGRETLLVDRGCPGMATAGSGDVLSGILAAVLGCNADNLLMAAAAGAWINGRAGELAQAENGAVSMLASDTAAAIRELTLGV